MKIIDIVKFNDGFAYVLDGFPKMKYREEIVKDDVFGNQKMLIGENEVGMMDFLTYHNYKPSQAFAGREFQIEMIDGSTRTLKDVWWDEGASRWQKLNCIDLVDFTHRTIEALSRCYVFCGGIARKDVVKKLIEQFNAEHPNYKVWEYYEYEKFLKTTN